MGQLSGTCRQKEFYVTGHNGQTAIHQAACLTSATFPVHLCSFLRLLHTSGARLANAIGCAGQTSQFFWELSIIIAINETWLASMTSLPCHARLAGKKYVAIQLHRLLTAMAP